VTDDSEGVAEAFAATKNNAFILEVDCPVYMHVGLDVTRTVWVDHGTHVDFSPAGLLIVDNVLIPSFVIADTHDVRLTNWNMKYVGSVPIDQTTNGYYDDGNWVPVAKLIPSTYFNDVLLTQWLASHRNVTFTWPSRAKWAGSADDSAIFYLTGNTSDIDVENMHVWVPKSASGDHYIPMVFAFTPTQASDQTVTIDTPLMQPYYAVPSNLTFSGITLDGTYFGFQGSAQNMSISNVVSYRYGDLQDANGGNVGGIGDWFAPPHLFYLNYDPNGDPSLFNQNITIKNVIDYGERVGAPRDTTSGNCYSLKLGSIHGAVSNYASFRPDGLMDVLPSTDLTLSDLTASYDSSFLHGAYPMIRFPMGPYHGVTFTNVKLQDTAQSTSDAPVWGNYDSSNTNIIFSNTSATLLQWTGTKPPGQPYFAGTGNSVDVQISFQ